MENKKPNKNASGWRIGLISAIVIGMLMWTIVTPYTPTIKTTDKETYQPSWHTVWSGPIQNAFAEGSLASGLSGITEVFFVNSTGTPNSTYTVNSTATIESWCTAAKLGYASADDFYTEIAHSTSFDIVVRIRANKTICANSTGDYAVFNGNRLRVNITSSALGINALTPMIRVESYNVSGTPAYMYCNYFINYSGSYSWANGLTITADSSNAITAIVFEAYY